MVQSLISLAEVIIEILYFFTGDLFPSPVNLRELDSCNPLTFSFTTDSFYLCVCVHIWKSEDSWRDSVLHGEGRVKLRSAGLTAESPHLSPVTSSASSLCFLLELKLNRLWTPEGTSMFSIFGSHIIVISLRLIICLKVFVVFVCGYVHVCVPTWMHVCVHVCMHPPRPEEGTGLLEPPDVVTELTGCSAASIAPSYICLWALLRSANTP